MEAIKPEFGDNIAPGMFVMLHAHDRKNSYHNGEYIVLASGPGRRSLICTKPSIGYGSHEPCTFYACEYAVIDSYNDQAALRDIADKLQYFAETPLRGEKLNWVEHVYTGAEQTARSLRRFLDIGDKQPKPSQIADILSLLDRTTSQMFRLASEMEKFRSQDAQHAALLEKIAKHFGVKA